MPPMASSMAQSRLEQKSCRKWETHSIFQEGDPTNVEWVDASAKYVVKSTGIFTSKEKAKAHLKNRTQRVIISASSTNACISMMGMTLEKYNSLRINSKDFYTNNCSTPWPSHPQQLWHHGGAHDPSPCHHPENCGKIMAGLSWTSLPHLLALPTTKTRSSLSWMGNPQAQPSVCLPQMCWHGSDPLSTESYQWWWLQEGGEVGTGGCSEGHPGKHWGPSCLLWLQQWHLLFHLQYWGWRCPQWPICQIHFLLCQWTIHSNRWWPYGPHLVKAPGSSAPAGEPEKDTDPQTMGSRCPNQSPTHCSPLHSFHPRCPGEEQGLGEPYLLMCH